MQPPTQPHRKRTRADGFDYRTAATYAVTICTHDHECVLGDVVEDAMALTDAGWAAQRAWLDLPNHYPHVLLDACIVMPNHLHGIVVVQPVLVHDDGTTYIMDWNDDRRVPPEVASIGLSEIVRGFKTTSARRINALRRTPGAPVWQRSFYDSIVRNGPQLERIREYFAANPGRWIEDTYNPSGRRR